MPFTLAQAQRLASPRTRSLLSNLQRGPYLRTGAEAAAVPMEIRWGSEGEADEFWIEGYPLPGLEAIQPGPSPFPGGED